MRTCPRASEAKPSSAGEIDGSDTQLAAYFYDGMHRRIVKTVDPDGADTDYDYYYNVAWQIVEVRKDGDADPLKQYVWDIRYIDAAVLRWYDDDTDGTAVAAHYYCTDANMNVTALVSDAGAVVERYVYDAYGKVTIYDDGWSDTRGSSSHDNCVLYAVYRWDTETGLHSVRFRAYHPTLGRWLQRDPVGYLDATNLYEYALSSPVRPVLPHPTRAAEDHATPDGQGDCPNAGRSRQAESAGCLPVPFHSRNHQFPAGCHSRLLLGKL